MSIKVSSILARKGSEVHTIGPDVTIEQVARLLADARIGATIVVEGEDIVGVCSERDIVSAVARDGVAALTASVRTIMSAAVITCSSATGTDELMSIMTERRVRHLPVVDDGKLAGIVSIGDIVKSRLGELADERAQLAAYVSGATY